MAGGLDIRRGSRVTTGLAPAWYDRYDKTYPATNKERIVYSVRENDNTLRVVGIVEIVYTDATKTVELYAERISL